MKYEEWEASVPAELRNDALWQMKVYRLGLFVAAIGWYDVTKLARDSRTISLSDQLYRSLGSISANIAEGYSRGSGKDRARFYEYSLGSARESRDWYYKGQPILGETVVIHRIQILTEVVRLLLTIIPRQRTNKIYEPPEPYLPPSPSPSDLPLLQTDIPFP